MRLFDTERHQDPQQSKGECLPARPAFLAVRSRKFERCGSGWAPGFLPTRSSSSTFLGPECGVCQPNMRDQTLQESMTDSDNPSLFLLDVSTISTLLPI